MSGKLFEGATGVCQAAAGVARHVLWYLSYQVDGSAGVREEPPARAARRKA
jgi:hypothetical protein